MTLAKTISLWILTFWITFAGLAAATPVSSTEPEAHHQRQRPDPIPDLTPSEINQGTHAHQEFPPASAAVDDLAQDDLLPGSYDTEDEYAVDGEDEYAVDDEDGDDDEYVDDFDDDDELEDDEFFIDEFDEDVAAEEEDLFSKLEGGTIPKRVVKMLKLISEDENFMDGKGNTVRSYMPVKKEACLGLGDAYVFTMQSMNDLRDPEDLKYAELHFYAKNFLDIAGYEYDEIPIVFYHAASAGCIPIGIQNLKIPQNGWLVTNVTSILSHVLLDDPSRVTIAMYIGQGGVSHTSPHHDTSQEKLVKPYAFVYTDDAATKKGHAQSNWEWLAESVVKNAADSLVPEHADAPSRQRREAMFNETNDTTGRSNEYPLHPVGVPHPASTHTAFTFFAEQNMRRIKSSRRRARNQRRKANNKNVMLDAVDDDRSRSRKKKLNKPRPKHLDIEKSDDLEANPCARHAMRVDFEAIKWGEYIIAPTEFESYYCTGQCSFPIDEDLRPSNHAIVQSVIQALRVQKVPSPCCVPEKMEPLNILYQNKDNDVILKKFNDMIVKSCYCL